jgi:hypothetical protein
MMSTLAVLLYSHTARLTAILLIVVMYWLTRLPVLGAEERMEMASHFAFVSAPLPVLSEASMRSVRAVHPALERISAWISSVGASVALHDLDGDGLANDLCYIEVRTDQVIVAPAPVGPTRYSPFSLEPPSTLYDPTSMAPMGCMPNDLNEDGLIDLLVYYWGRTPVAFLRQGSAYRQESGLTDGLYMAQELIAGGERWFTNAATAADLDGDGHVDLIFGNYFQDHARILDATASEPTAMQHSMSRAYNAGRNRLLVWKGATSGAQPSVQFEEMAGVLEDEVAHSWTLAVAAADIDGDLLPELYFANDFGPDRLLYNRSQPGQLRFERLAGIKGFTTPSSKVLGRDSYKGMGADFGDLNGDGLLDLYVSNIAAEYSLEESHFAFINTGELKQMPMGEAPFVEQSEALGLSRSGWGWESRLGDFNNDGALEALQATGFVKGHVNRWPELHELAMGNDELLSHPGSWPRFRPGDDLSGHQHNPFFVRARDGRFYDLAADLGLDAPQVSRGIATADVDGDGDLDFAVANQWEPSNFYRNDCPHCGAFLGLRLLLPVGDCLTNRTCNTSSSTPMTGRPAIGAAATVHRPDGRRLVGQVDGGNGHSGDRSPELHFGLGEWSPNAPVQVELHWRDAAGRIHHTTQQLTPGWHTIILGSD